MPKEPDWPIAIVRCLACGEVEPFAEFCSGEGGHHHGPTRKFYVVPTCLCSLKEQHPHCPVHMSGGLRDQEAQKAASGTNFSHA